MSSIHPTHFLSLAALALSVAGCSDTLAGPTGWTADEPGAIANGESRPAPDAGPTSTSSETEPDPVTEPICDLSDCGSVPVCHVATCAENGSCEVVLAPAGTPCENPDFCDVLSACDGAGTCQPGVSAEMYLTFEDDLRLLDLRPDGKMLLGGATLKDGVTWRPIVVLVDANGAILWRRELEAATSGGIFHGAWSDGGWIVSGYEGRTATLVRLDTSGGMAWKREFDGGYGSYTYSPQVVVTGDDIFVFGSRGDDDDGDAWIAGLTPEGDVRWTREYATDVWDYATRLVIDGDELTLLGRSEDRDDDAYAPNVWMMTLSRGGSVRTQRELLGPAHRHVVWAGVHGDTLEMVVSERLDPPKRELTLRRIDTDGDLETTAHLGEGEVFRRSSVVENDGELVIIREDESPKNYLLFDRWDRAGNKIDSGALLSPTGDPVARGSTHFLDDETLVMSGSIWEAQSSYAWSRRGTVLRRVRPFHAGVCTEAWQTGQACLSADDGSCDDGNPCTADLCDAATGCGHRPFYDGRPCGAGDVCYGGECVPECASTCAPGDGWCSGTAITICETDADGCTDYVTRSCDEGTACVYEDPSPMWPSTVTCQPI